MKPTLRPHFVATSITAAALVLFGGCTTTRLGDLLIPKHPDSAQSTGELVRLDVVPVSEPKSDSTEKKPAALNNGTTPDNAAASSTSVLGAVAGIAIDTAISELNREAERYEAQFGSRVLKKTSEIKSPQFLILTRWVDSGKKPPGAAIAKDTWENWVNKRNERQKRESAADNKPNSKPADSGATPESTLEAEGPAPEALTLTAIHREAKADDARPGKELAFLFVAQVEEVAAGDDKAPAVFKLEPKLLWDRRTSAKIVDFHLSQLPKFWQWPGALLFKTDSNVNVSIQTTLKTLARGADGTLKPVTIDPSHPLAVAGTTNLNDNKEPTEFADGGVWFGVPLIAKLDSTNLGFLSIEFTVTETDASNVRRLVEKGAASLEERKDSLLERLVK